ncbi:hypothetical protein FKR81_41135 [Lentzea tibetensis]|uniref:Uncharacterized protein n=1 Tax=Lentzea tibetensis TaxID=2591470 RepID=A0A563EFX3_9PSEU|nr:hypothetical protein FKR81_41135 [Lentzea tibetensis]
MGGCCDVWVWAGWGCGFGGGWGVGGGGGGGCGWGAGGAVGWWAGSGGGCREWGGVVRGGGE